MDDSIESLFTPDTSKPRVGAPQEPYGWLIIDGGGLAVTAWATHRTQESPADRVRAAVYVCVTTIASLSRLVSAGAKIVIAWDGEDNRKWRRGYHPWYKHGRGTVIDRNEVRAVVQRIRELVRAVGIAEVQLPGREADDLVGTLARELDEMEQPVLLFSDDKDYLQCVDHNVHLARRSLQGIVLSPEQCELLGVRYGLDYLHMKAVMGDPGDNIKGLHGIGEVKAGEMIDQIPDFMADALEDPTSIDWGRLKPATMRAFVRAGRRLLFPAAPENLEFATKHSRCAIPLPEPDEAACLEAAAAHAFRQLMLVELDLHADVSVRDLVFPEPNVERIPSLLRSLDLGNETDLIGSLYALASFRGAKGATPPRTSAVRAGAAIVNEEGAPWREEF